MRRQLNSCASRALHAIYIRHTGEGAPNFMPRVAFTRASFPAPSLPSLSSPLSNCSSRTGESSLMLFFRTYSKKKIKFRYGRTNSRYRTTAKEERVRVAREPRYPRFTVHLSVQESPSDKFQVSRLNERTVLPPLLVGGKKKWLITRIHVILKREIYRQLDPIIADPIMTRVSKARKKYANESCFQKLNDLNKAK